MHADDDDEPPMEWSAVPREFFVAEVKRVLTPLMPNAREPVSGQDDALFALRQVRFVIRYGDGSEEVATHWSLPIAIATLLVYGRHAVLYRFEDEDESEGAVTLPVLFEEGGSAALEFASQCLNEAEEIVGSGSFDEEE